MVGLRLTLFSVALLSLMGAAELAYERIGNGIALLSWGAGVIGAAALMVV